MKLIQLVAEQDTLRKYKEAHDNNITPSAKRLFLLDIEARYRRVINRGEMPAFEMRNLFGTTFQGDKSL